MARNSLQSSLEDLRDDVLQLGETVRARLRDVVTAIETGDETLAAYVRDNDGEVNAAYRSLEATCVELFALEQPVAGDLRLVAASFKILTDLERIGDLSTNLAGYVAATSRDIVPRDRLVDIGTLAVELLDDALLAYARRDAELCVAVTERDDELDARCGRAADLLMRSLLEREPSRPELEELLDTANELLLTIRDLERVGDHAVNVAARTYYATEGSDELLY